MHFCTASNEYTLDYCKRDIFEIILFLAGIQATEGHLAPDIFHRDGERSVSLYAGVIVKSAASGGRSATRNADKVIIFQL